MNEGDLFSKMYRKIEKKTVKGKTIEWEFYFK